MEIYTNVRNCTELNVVYHLTSHLLQGTSGTALKNPGITGTYWPDALFLNSACVYPSSSRAQQCDRGAHEFMLREAYPNIRTVDYWLGGNKAERFPQSRYVGPRGHYVRSKY